MPPIIPRERFGAERRDLLRVGGILIGQARANPRPRLPEFQFAVVEVGASPSVIAALGSAVDVAGQCPLRVLRCRAVSGQLTCRTKSLRNRRRSAGRRSRWCGE
jgi:hypothetical protein